MILVAVYMQFQICFTTAKYDNAIISLCETFNEFIHAFCLSKIHSNQSGPLKLIKTMLKSFFMFVRLSSSIKLLSKE